MISLLAAIKKIKEFVVKNALLKCKDKFVFVAIVSPFSVGIALNVIAVMRIKIKINLVKGKSKN